jgi:hypothetical protein
MSEGTPVGTDDSGSESLADFVGSMMGDYRSSESSEPTGTPPASPEAPTAVPKGTEPVEPTATPPDGAPTTPPDAAAPETDPLASATPFTYTVDGKAQTYDGIRVLGDDGAIIDADKLADLGTRLGERDRLVGVNQQLYQEKKALEPLTQWTTTGADGKEQTISGQAGLIEFHASNARKDAIIAAYDAMFEAKDGQLPPVFDLFVNVEGKILPDEKAWRAIFSEVRWNAKTAEDAVRGRLGTAVTEAAKPAPAQINYEASAPALIQSLAGADFKLLTPQDLKSLSGQVKFYARPGTTTIEDQFGDRVKELIALRQEQAKLGPVLTDAAKANAAKLAAAARGQKPGTPVKPTPKPSEAQVKATEAQDLYDLQEKAAAAALRRRSA